MAIDKRTITKADFTIYQGETLKVVVRCNDAETGEPMDLTGFTPRSQIRVNFEDLVPVATFTASWLDASVGAIYLYLSAEETAALDFNKAKYDVEIEDEAGDVTRVVMGTVALSKEATK